MAFKQPKSPIKKGGSWSEWGHGLLDAAGLVPGFGEIADGANALWYGAEGDKVNAALSTAAMVPFLGWGATATKLGLKAAKKLGKKVIKEGSEKAVKNKEALSKFSNKMGNNSDLTKRVTDVKAPPKTEKLAHYGEYSSQKADDITDIMKGKGKAWDEAKAAGNYNPKYTEEIPFGPNRRRVKMSQDGLPDVHYLQSSGGGKKFTNNHPDFPGKNASSKGQWYQVEGMTTHPNKPGNWFAKTDGWDTGYGSKTLYNAHGEINKALPGPFKKMAINPFQRIKNSRKNAL